MKKREAHQLRFQHLKRTYFSPAQLPLMQPLSTMTKRRLTNYTPLSESAVNSEKGYRVSRHMQINTLHL